MFFLFLLILASIPVLFCPIGLLIIGLLTDKIGRIKSLQIAYIPLIISWLVIAYAKSLKTIIIGRIIMGTTFGKFFLLTSFSIKLLNIVIGYSYTQYVRKNVIW